MADTAARILGSLPQLSEFRWSSKDDTQQFQVHNPATGKVLTTVQAGDVETAHDAVLASENAFQKWRWRTRQERSVLLFKAADELEKHSEDLAVLLCLENGKPWKDAFLMWVSRSFGSIADNLPSEFFDQGPIYSTVIYEPHGVCIGILPFNWPPVHVGGKLAPCLAAGNTMILKPGEQAPLTLMRIVDILQTVFRKDVVQAVPGLGSDVPSALIAHPLVEMVSLTGSSASGSAAAATAASNLSPTVLELGGKNAFVTFDDADLDVAVRDTVDGCSFNKGESCTASTRILVHDSIYPEFTRRLGVAVGRPRTGDGLDERTHVGPLISQARQRQVLEYIELEKKNGATLAAQGIVSSDERLRGGFFVPPTLFTDVTPNMAVARDEIFGPVLAVGRFATEDEAVGIVNESEYGLFSGVYSEDFARAMRVARKLDVRGVLVNNYFRAFLGTPFGGVKASGYGREHWIGTLREWSRIKNIRYSSGLGAIPSWRGASDVC